MSSEWDRQDGTDWRTRLVAFRRVLEASELSAMELHDHGGQHPMYLEKARLCQALDSVLVALFPEIAEVAP